MEKSFQFTEEMRDRARDILRVCHPEKRSALLRILWLVHEQEGYIPKDSAKTVGSMLDIAAEEVIEVASFYGMLNDRPNGSYHIKICMGPCCGIKNSRWLLSHLEKLLGIKAGQTTMDNLFTLSQVECLGYCSDAPTMQINNIYYDNLNPDMLDEIIGMLNR